MSGDREERQPSRRWSGDWSRGGGPADPLVDVLIPTVGRLAELAVTLAGLAAQDPYAVVPEQRAFTAEPYGLGIPPKNVDFVRFVNARLAQMRRNGEWKAIYNRWLAESLGPAPSPPKAVYGRTP